MYLTETHIINGTDELDLITFKCKNLYNKANYIIRQEFINNGKYISKFDMFNIMKSEQEYKDLPTRVARGVLNTLNGNWISFFKTIKDWSKNKSKYRNKPNLPNYLPKNGKFNAIFIDSGILKPKEGKLGLSSLKQRFHFKCEFKDIKIINVVPLKSGKYRINITYSYKEKDLKTDNNKYCSIDCGVNNLMTLTSNVGLIPTIINGCPLKSINQYYNKLLAEYKSELPKNVYTSKKIIKLTEKRNNKINTYLHQASSYLIKYCLENDINTIIMGYNKEWKQEVNIGKKNNQNFVSIPFYKLKHFIEYKCKMYGLNFIDHEESYTSKCSFMDQEEIKKHDNYLGRRVKRGLFKSKNDIIINSDVNGSGNIMRKVVPDVEFTNGIEVFAVTPVKVTFN